MPDKISKDEAEYHRNAAAHNCKDCDMFRSPDGCTLVSGHIDRNATCRFWERRKED